MSSYFRWKCFSVIRPGPKSSGAGGAFVVVPMFMLGERHSAAG